MTHGLARFLQEGGSALNASIIEYCKLHVTKEALDNACDLACAYMKAGKSPGRALADALEEHDALG